MFGLFFRFSSIWHHLSLSPPSVFYLWISTHLWKGKGNLSYSSHVPNLDPPRPCQSWVALPCYPYCLSSPRLPQPTNPWNYSQHKYWTANTPRLASTKKIPPWTKSGSYSFIARPSPLQTRPLFSIHSNRYNSLARSGGWEGWLPKNVPFVPECNFYGQDGPCCYKWLPKNVPCLNSLTTYDTTLIRKQKIWTDENLDSRSRRNNWTPKIVPKAFVLPPSSSWSKYDLLYPASWAVICCPSLHCLLLLLGIHHLANTLEQNKISFSFSSFCFYVRAPSSLDGEGKVDLFSLAFFSPSSPASYHIPTLQINQWSTPCAASCGVLPTRFILIHYNLGCTSCSVLQDITEIFGGLLIPCACLLTHAAHVSPSTISLSFHHPCVVCVCASCMWRSRRKSESNRARLPVGAACGVGIS